MTGLKYFVFDAYGTLFDVHSAAAKYKDEIGEDWDRLSQIWRAKHLEYSWIYGRIGVRKSFWQLTGDSLDYAIASVAKTAKVGPKTNVKRVSNDLRDKLLNAYLTLDAYEEVPFVLRGLREAGAKTAILSNGDPDMLERAIQSAGLADVLDDAISVQDARTFKPDFKVYGLVTGRYGCAPGEVSFQSSNRWDAAAAKAFGFQVAWVNRTGQAGEYNDLPPDQEISDLRPLLDLIG